ncbi:hypothetical protein Tco_0589761, partial [Tanacetum coccineum]
DEEKDVSARLPPPETPLTGSSLSNYPGLQVRENLT